MTPVECFGVVGASYFFMTPWVEFAFAHCLWLPNKELRCGKSLFIQALLLLSIL